MNVISFPLARRLPATGTKKQLRRGAQHYLDIGSNRLQRQYRDGSEVKSEGTVFLQSGEIHTFPISHEFIHYNCPDVIACFAIISVNWQSNQFIYVDGRELRKKALSLFLLDKKTGDPMSDMVLVTQIDGPPGRDKFKYARPSNWQGRTTTLPIWVFP